VNRVRLEAKIERNDAQTSRRWYGYSDACKEIARYVAIAVVLGLISEALKQPGMDLAAAC